MLPNKPLISRFWGKFVAAKFLNARMETLEQAQATWNACLNDIKMNVSEDNFSKWFLPMRALKQDGYTLTVEAPTRFFVETIERNFKRQLTHALRTAIGDNGQLCYSVKIADTNQVTPARPNGGGMSGGYVATPVVPDPFKGVAVRGPMVDPQLNDAYTFDTYVVGESNRMAASVAEAVAAAPGKTAFNPLFVYGGPGVGKTHLIQAIGAKAKNVSADMTVAYLSADRFMRQYMDAKTTNQISGFMHFYQSIGLLILDDIQELGGESRARTADVFFQIFNHLLQNGRQVVLASDKKPSELTGLQERLLSRFRSGMVAEVRSPDRETRLGIVRAKAGADGLVLPDEVVQYVASNVSGNARELQGALVSLLAHATLTNTDINLALAQEVVSELVCNPKPELITKDVIIDAVCDFFKIEPEMMQKNTRKREVVIARQIAMFLCKKLTTDSLTTIGASLGNRNHSTVVYACRSIEGLIETDSKIAEAVQAIEDSIK